MKIGPGILAISGALAFLSALAIPSGANAATPLKTVRIAQGLSFPLFATAPPGDTARIFIVERRGADNRGRIKILKNGATLPTPFLTTSVLSSGTEQGLLGLAFAPDYDLTGRFYINYTDAAGTTVIKRHTASADPDVADTTGTVIFSLPQPYANHNGGWLGFGPDGDLYVALGDGGSAGDPGDRAQNLGTYFGKILRLDVRGAAYAAPPTNPFAGAVEGLDEIWCFGLRNPWRCSFDRRTGDLVIGDVGQSLREEVDFASFASGGGAGANYGWRCYEGTLPYAASTTTPCDSCDNPTCPFVFPAHDYDHSGGRCSITGGYVYRGLAIPDLSGEYFFADYCTAQIYSGRFQGGVLTGIVERTSELAPGGGLSIGGIPSFGEDGNGEILICDSSDGELYKIVPAATPGGIDPGPSAPPRATLRVLGTPAHPPVELEVTLPGPGPVALGVFDAAGRRVRTLREQALGPGLVLVAWDGRSEDGLAAASGVYWFRLRTEWGDVVRRAVLVR